MLAAVQGSADAGASWKQIYAEWIEPVVQLVDDENVDEAAELALSTYAKIERQVV